jgi:hypothetical protein
MAKNQKECVGKVGKYLLNRELNVYFLISSANSTMTLTLMFCPFRLKMSNLFLCRHFELCHVSHP